MSTATAIEWTDATWNPVAGCSILSPGCSHCYAMGMAARIERMNPAATHYAGLTQPSKAGPVWTGKVALAPDSILLAPLRWKKPRRIFVNSMSDLFHEAVPDEWIDRIFAVMALTPQHTYQVLTKRAGRMWTYMNVVPRRDRITAAAVRMRTHVGKKEPLLPDSRRTEVVGLAWPLPNVWLGVSTERQQEADERIPLLLATPAARRFISAEPLLGPIDIRWAASRNRLDIAAGFLARGRFSPGLELLRPLDWVIAGGESGPRARPMHPDWVRGLRDQCAAALVPFFFKQWGEWEPREEWSPRQPNGRFEPMVAIMADGSECPHDVAPQDVGAYRMARVGKKAAGARLDGREHREFPQ